MTCSRRLLALVVAAIGALIVTGCATPLAPAPVGDAAAKAAGASVLRSLPGDRALEDRILALNPDAITADDVKVLATGPTPRIVLLHGGIYPVHMAMTSFGGFLTDMGYPESKIRNPADETWSHSPYESSAEIAGLLAGYYEREGLRPVMIGHSQGGIQAVKVLRELAGQFGDQLAVRDPIDNAAQGRTSFVDPVLGKERPVVGFTLPYVSVVAAGGAALLLPNQWSMIGHVKTVPDTVENFTGYSLEFDTWAWSIGGVDATNKYEHNGTAKVRNVMLPGWYNHVLLPITKDLASDPKARAWIEAYAPARANGPVPLEETGQSVLWAADVWHSVKKHWCLEAQRAIRARRALLG